MNLSRIRRCMIKSEEIRSKFIEEGRSKLLKFWGLQNLATCKFGNLRNFASCQFSQPVNTAHYSPVPHLCLLTAFLPTFLVVLYKFALMCFWFFNTLLQFPFTENLNKLSHACNQINFSLNQSIRLARSFLPLLLVIFSSSPFTFLHFLGSQTPLDDDKSRDARLKTHDP